jgi:hypothetical protein
VAETDPITRREKAVSRRGFNVAHYKQLHAFLKVNKLLKIPRFHHGRRSCIASFGKVANLTDARVSTWQTIMYHCGLSEISGSYSGKWAWG